MSEQIDSIKVNFDALKNALVKKFGPDFEEDLWIQRLIETIDSYLEG